MLAHGGGLPFYELMPEVAKAMAMLLIMTGPPLPFSIRRRFMRLSGRSWESKRYFSGRIFPSFPVENIFRSLRLGFVPRGSEKDFRSQFFGIAGIGRKEGRMKHAFLDHHSREESSIHHLDARAKIIVFFTFILVGVSSLLPPFFSWGFWQRPS